MSSSPKEEAGMNTPPKNNNLENIAPNTESILETDQKVEASKLLKQEQEVPNRGLGTPLTDAAHQDPDKELALIIEETFRMVQSLRREQEREDLEQLAKAQALHESKHEEMKKLTKHLQQTKLQEPTAEHRKTPKRGTRQMMRCPPKLTISSISHLHSPRIKLFSNSDLADRNISISVAKADVTR